MPVSCGVWLLCWPVGGALFHLPVATACLSSPRPAQRPTRRPLIPDAALASPVTVTSSSQGSVLLAALPSACTPAELALKMRHSAWVQSQEQGRLLGQPPELLCPALLELVGCALIFFFFNPKCLAATLGLIKLIRHGHNLLIRIRDHVCPEQLGL